MELIDKLFESEFSKKLMENSVIVINKWRSIHAERFKKKLKYESFESVGTQTELKFYNKSQKFWAIQQVLEDLNNVFLFLKINSSKILEYYPHIKTQENYYKYHFENYIFRVTTLLDLTGKLGNILFETGIRDDKCNGYNFKEKLKKDHPKLAILVENILKDAEENKKKRNKKLHTGQLEIDELNEIAIWDDYSTVFSQNLNDDPFFKAMTDENIEKMIKNLKTSVINLIGKINIFLDKSIDKI